MLHIYSLLFLFQLMATDGPDVARTATTGTVPCHPCWPGLVATLRWGGAHFLLMHLCPWILIWVRRNYSGCKRWTRVLKRLRSLGRALPRHKGTLAQMWQTKTVWLNISYLISQLLYFVEVLVIFHIQQTQFNLLFIQIFAYIGIENWNPSGPTFWWIFLFFYLYFLVFIYFC